MSESMGMIIRRLRKERGLTQEELAELLGVTFQAVSKWENETGLPDISQVVPLANVFGVTTDILFGTDSVEETDDIEDFIKEIEHKLCNCSDEEELKCQLDCAKAVQKKLKDHPSNYRLLAYSMGNLYGLIGTLEDAGRHNEAKMWMNEFIHHGNVILSHCTDVEYLNKANRWFVYFYLDINDTQKAEEHARRLPFDFRFNNGCGVLSYVMRYQGNQEECMKLTSNVIYDAFQLLADELHRLGAIYSKAGKLEEAYTCFALFPDIYDLITKGRAYDIPFYRMQSYDQLAMVCMKMGRQDEAMTHLERYLRLEKTTAKTYNIVTESKIPYFYGRTLKYSHDHYTARGDISEVMRKKIFDPIRDTDRVRALEKEVLAFEEKHRE